MPGGRDPARGRRRGERRHPARAAHARPHLAHGPPQPGGTRCAGARRRRSAPSTCATWCGGTTASTAPGPTSRRCCTPSSGRPRGSWTPTAVCSPPGNSPAARPVGGRMQAIQFHRYGGPEELQWAEAPEPHAGPGQIRIAVRAASVNPLDWKVLSGRDGGRRRAGRAGLPRLRRGGCGRRGRRGRHRCRGGRRGVRRRHRHPGRVRGARHVGAQARLRRLGGGRGGGRRGRDRGARPATAGRQGRRHGVRRRRRGRGRRGRRADGPGARGCG